MKIKSLRAFQLHLPFRFSFTHAHLRRTSSQNIIVETTLDSGIKGYGESLPRDYVTGETPEKVLAIYEKLDLNDLSNDFQNYEEVVGSLRNHGFLKGDSREENAARCALEISLLDAFSKQFERPLLSFYEGTAEEGEKAMVPVSGIISLGSLKKLMAYVTWVKAVGFKAVKIKVSGDVKCDLKRLGLIRRFLGQKVDLRIDANMAYSFEDALKFLHGAQRFGVRTIEDPVNSQCLDRLPELKALTNAEIILDEPICTLQEAKRFLEKSYFDVINIRLSKCGGFLKSFEIADFLWNEGKEVQLGCQVGETGILTAAGWHFARNFGCLKYYEGGYDSYLLSGNVIQEKFKIRKGGDLSCELSDTGLGVTVLEEKLSSWEPQKTSS